MSFDRQKSSASRWSQPDEIVGLVALPCLLPVTCGRRTSQHLETACEHEPAATSSAAIIGIFPLTDRTRLSPNHTTRPLKGNGNNWIAQARDMEVEAKRARVTNG